MNERMALLERAEQAEAEVKKLREALRWYADMSRYCDRYGPMMSSQMDVDAGAIARAALGETK